MIRLRLAYGVTTPRRGREDEMKGMTIAGLVVHDWCDNSDPSAGKYLFEQGLEYWNGLKIRRLES